MKIALLEPFAVQSHRQWMEGLVGHSVHDIESWSLSGAHWKWRMHGGAITLAERIKQSGVQPDLFLASDMMDCATFRALLPPGWRQIPLVLYMHENQLSYPWSPGDPDPSAGRDRHYAFINYSSCLSADHILWSSTYHFNSFMDRLPEFLRAFPDHQNEETIGQITEKSSVLAPGVSFDTNYVPEPRKSGEVPVLLWNHRWEYDKGPEAFFRLLLALNDRNCAFKVVVLGEEFTTSPSIFQKARALLGDHILHWGYAQERKQYIDLCSKSHLLPVTSIQDFFGYSILEAAWYGAIPLLPRRLVYPEHFAAPGLFYDTEEELLEKTLSWLTGSIPQMETERKQLLRYHWSQMIPQYDAFFEKFANKP